MSRPSKQGNFDPTNKTFKKEIDTMKKNLMISEIEELEAIWQEKRETEFIDRWDALRGGLYKNLFSLLKRDGVDTSSIDDGAMCGIAWGTAIDAVIAIEADMLKELFGILQYNSMRDNLFQYISFEQDYIDFVNNLPEMGKYTATLSLYQVLMQEYYEDCDAWMEFLFRTIRLIADFEKPILYERLANILSLFLFNSSTIEDYRAKTTKGG